MATLYRDDYVTLDDEQLTVRRYHFPLGTSKVVPYASMRSVREVKMSLLLERLRLWGGGLHGQWMHLDLMRPFKHKCIVIGIDGIVDVGITPDDHDQVYALLCDKTKRPDPGPTG